MKSAGLLLLFAVCARATTFTVTVAGLGGEPEYEQRFAAIAQDLDRTLKASGPDQHVETLYGSNATKAHFEAVLTRFAKEAKPQDSLIVMFIGHGSFDGTDYKVNIPGPDISAADVAALLDRFPAGKQLVVNMTSASGGCVHALQQKNRLVITATRSGTEKNATVFARYWAEALHDANADTDKNDVITAQEAFNYAQQKTKAFYETQKRLATEHSQLETYGNTGLSANQFTLVRIGAAQLASKDPAKRELLPKREQLELQIDDLKLRKAALSEEDYKGQLTALLLQLAKMQAALDKTDAHQDAAHPDASPTDGNHPDSNHPDTNHPDAAKTDSNKMEKDKDALKVESGK